MSTNWDLGCRTCDVTSGLFDENHGEDSLLELIAAAHGLAQLPESLPYIASSDSHRLTSLGVFFRAHAGHDLRPKNEYGQWLGDCRKYNTCTCCGHMWTCLLPEKHEGECSPRNRK